MYYDSHIVLQPDVYLESIAKIGWFDCTEGDKWENYLKR